MVHWAKQQCNVIGVISKATEILGISLGNGDVFAGNCILSENLNIVFDQLYGIDPVALLREMVAVSAGGRANLQDAHSGAQIFFDVAHSSQIFYHAKPGAKSVIFVVASIILRECL
jgi:hypothetical protein